MMRATGVLAVTSAPAGGLVATTRSCARVFEHTRLGGSFTERPCLVNDAVAAGAVSPFTEVMAYFASGDSNNRITTTPVCDFVPQVGVSESTVFGISPGVAVDV